jgi:hypothetical protein
VTDYWGALLIYALITAGAYLLIPILFLAVVAAVGIVGFIYSMFTREE